MLSDDDWLEQGYIAQCLAALSRTGPLPRLRPRAIPRATGGRAAGLDDASSTPPSSSACSSYLRRRRRERLFYGLMSRATPARRRAAAQRARQRLAGRRRGWRARSRRAAPRRSTASWRHQRRLPPARRDARAARRQASIPHLVIAWEVFRDISARAAVYRELRPVQRARLALAGAWAVISWRSLAWHMTAPVARSLQRRRRGRGLARAYDRFTRALGAGVEEQR